MFKKQKGDFFESYILENRIRVIINLCFALAGALCGGAVFLQSKNPDVLAEWAKEYVLKLEAAAGYDVFISSIKDAGIVCIIFYICSLFYIGEFLCPAYVFARCAAHGFSGCLVMSAYGITNGALILLSIVPHMIFYISSILIFSVETAKQSRFTGRGGLKAGVFFSYFLSTFFPVLLLFLGCLVEGFVSTYLILWCIKKF